MDLIQMISVLREEREVVDQAISVLERLTLLRGKRRGRPPAWLTAQQSLAPEQAPAKKQGTRGRKPKK